MKVTDFFVFNGTSQANVAAVYKSHQPYICRFFFYRSYNFVQTHFINFVISSKVVSCDLKAYFCFTVNFAVMSYTCNSTNAIHFFYLPRLFVLQNDDMRTAFALYLIALSRFVIFLVNNNVINYHLVSFTFSIDLDHYEKNLIPRVLVFVRHSDV